MSLDLLYVCQKRQALSQSIDLHDEYEDDADDDFTPVARKSNQFDNVRSKELKIIDVGGLRRSYHVEQWALKAFDELSKGFLVWFLCHGIRTLIVNSIGFVS